jgi:hypothetical protein
MGYGGYINSYSYSYSYRRLVAYLAVFGRERVAQQRQSGGKGDCIGL